LPRSSGDTDREPLSLEARQMSDAKRGCGTENMEIQPHKTCFIAVLRFSGHCVFDMTCLDHSIQ
jgi:hypothetical protein